MTRPTAPAPPVTKNDIRQFAEALRASYGEDERALASRDIAYRLIEIPAFLSAITIMAYAPVRGELLVEPALDLRRRVMGDNPRVAFPRVTGEREMEARFSELAELKTGSFDVPEPTAKAVFLDPDDIDAVLVPGLAFDRRGFRVGYGKGFYDAYLARLGRNATTIGLSYDETVLDTLPIEIHDSSVDMIVTPSRVLVC